MADKLIISGEKTKNAIIVSQQKADNKINISGENGSNSLTAINNNAKYYTDKAEDFANKAEQSAIKSANSATQAQESASSILNDEGFIAVSQNFESINTVANSVDDVNYVADNAGKIEQIVEDLQNLGDTTNINIVATNIDNINSLAENIQTIEENKNIVLEKVEESKVNANNASQSASSSLASSNNAKIWAEGTDAEVQALGGEHSAKVWAEQGGSSVDLTGYIKNKEIISGAISIGNTTSTVQSTTVGGSAYSAKNGSSFGYSSRAEGQNSVALGYKAQTTGTSSIQIGEGTNTTANTLQVKNYPLMNLSTGKIYADRLEATGANVDLSNLSSEGEKHFLNKSQITNCLLEVPQRIKLELVDGAAILKAESEVIVPNGENTFDYVTITTDLTCPNGGTSSNSDAMLFYNATSKTLTYGAVENVTSGTTAPTGGGYFYDTNNNVIKYYTSGVQGSYIYGYPVALATRKNGAFTSIKQVFNGFGVIGSTVWVDKGVKGLIPDGRNEDGSLKNREFTVGSLLTFSYNYTGTAKLMLKENAIRYAGAKSYSYNVDENIVYDAGSKVYECNIGEAEVSSGVITSFKPKQPFKAVDWNDKSSVVGWLMPDYSKPTVRTLATEYIAEDNLYLTCTDNTSHDDTYFIILINYKDVETKFSWGGYSDSTDIQRDFVGFNIPKGAKFNITRGSSKAVITTFPFIGNVE